MYKLQRYQESIPFYEKAIELNPKDRIFLNSKVISLALAIQRQKKCLTDKDNAFLEQSLLSEDLLNQKNGCLALSYAAENGQKLSPILIKYLL